MATSVTEEQCMGRRLKARRPKDFWRPFTIWWRQHRESTGRRATITELWQWYQENSSTVWPAGLRPSFRDLEYIAKGMRTLEQASMYFRTYRRNRKAKLALAATAPCAQQRATRAEAAAADDIGAVTGIGASSATAVAARQVEVAQHQAAAPQQPAADADSACAGAAPPNTSPSPVPAAVPSPSPSPSPSPLHEPHAATATAGTGLLPPDSPSSGSNHTGPDTVVVPQQHPEYSCSDQLSLLSGGDGSDDQEGYSQLEGGGACDACSRGDRQRHPCESPYHTSFPTQRQQHQHQLQHQPQYHHLQQMAPPAVYTPPPPHVPPPHAYWHPGVSSWCPSAMASLGAQPYNLYYPCNPAYLSLYDLGNAFLPQPQAHATCQPPTAGIAYTEQGYGTRRTAPAFHPPMDLPPHPQPAYGSSWFPAASCWQAGLPYLRQEYDDGSFAWSAAAGPTTSNVSPGPVTAPPAPALMTVTSAPHAPFTAASRTPGPNPRVGYGVAVGVGGTRRERPQQPTNHSAHFDPERLEERLPEADAAAAIAAAAAAVQRRGTTTRAEI